MIELPQVFTERMKGLLSPEEYTAFIESYEKERTQGLRINLLKTEKGRELAAGQFQLERFPGFPTAIIIREVRNQENTRTMKQDCTTFRNPVRWQWQNFLRQSQGNGYWICVQLQRKEHPAGW